MRGYLLRAIPLVVLAVLAVVAMRGGVQAEDSVTLPEEVFKPGKRVYGLEAYYTIEEVQGGWIKARLYRSLDKPALNRNTEAPPIDPAEPRWIYVPAAAGPWVAVE